jgi:hypothetical protein
MLRPISGRPGTKSIRLRRTNTSKTGLRSAVCRGVSPRSWRKFFGPMTSPPGHGGSRSRKSSPRHPDRGFSRINRIGADHCAYSAHEYPQTSAPIFRDSRGDNPRMSHNRRIVDTGTPLARSEQAPLLTPSEVAQRLAVSRKMIYALIHRGDLPACPLHRTAAARAGVGPERVRTTGQRGGAPMIC